MENKVNFIGQSEEFETFRKETGFVTNFSAELLPVYTEAVILYSELPIANIVKIGRPCNACCDFALYFTKSDNPESEIGLSAFWEIFERLRTNYKEDIIKYKNLLTKDNNFPPCNVGDTVYVINKEHKVVLPCKVTAVKTSDLKKAVKKPYWLEVSFNKHSLKEGCKKCPFSEEVIKPGDYSCYCCAFDNTCEYAELLQDTYNKQWFLSRELACKALYED